MTYKKKNSEYDFPKELITVGNKYSRNDINQRLEKGRIDGFKGITQFNNCFALFVTLEKADKPKNQKYKDFFKNKKEFFWESQQPDKTNKFGSPNTPEMISLLNREKTTILFARIINKTKGHTNKFIYCGELDVESFDNGANNLRPFGVKFITKEIPREMPSDLADLINWKPLNNLSLIEAENLATVRSITKEEDINDSDCQGRIDNQKLKKAVEDYAMKKASDHYESHGYSVFDESKKRTVGYDLRCERPGSTKLVEVKGSLNSGWCVLVTKNEVDSAMKQPVDLFVVNKITYEWINEECNFECNGGEERIISPWKPKSKSTKCSLKAINYKFCPDK